MAMTYSSRGGASELFPMGNGELLVWEEGVSIYSLQNGYSSPHLFSLTPDFGGQYYETNTRRIQSSMSVCHRLYFSDEILGLPNRGLCDVQMIDLLLPDKAVFLRRFEGISGAVFRLRIPPYVRAVYHPSYRFEKMRADALFLTVPAGTAFDRGMVTLQEHTVMLTFSGSLRFDPSDFSLRFEGDQGELCILRADDPKEALRFGEALLREYREYSESPHLHPYFGKILYALSDLSAEPSVDLAAQLLAMQSASGAIVASQREPYAKAESLPALTAYFLQKGSGDRALRMLLYWTALSEQRGFVPSAISCVQDSLCPDKREEPLSAAAYLWATAHFCRQCPPDPRTADALYRGMRMAYSALMQSFREGMLPFGQQMQAFEAGLLGDALVFQGSAEVTALAISAGREFAAYCRENGKRMAKSQQGYSSILQSAEVQFDDRFSFGGSICRNAPRLETLTRRPRFLRGICSACKAEGAYPTEDMLELGRYGQYLCRRCAATRKEQPNAADPAKRYSSPRATAIAALGADSAVAIGELLRLAAEYTKSLQDPDHRLPLREADTDPLVLLAMNRHRDAILAWLTKHPDEWEILLSDAELLASATPQRVFDRLRDAVRTVLRREMGSGMLSHLLCDTEPSGAFGASSDTALALLALDDPTVT